MRKHTFKKLKSHEKANLHNTKMMKTFYEKDTELNDHVFMVISHSTNTEMKLKCHGN